MVDTLDEIKGYKKLSFRRKAIFIFKLKDYLDSLDKEVLEVSDILSVKWIKKKKYFELNMIISNIGKTVYLD